jgi:formylmethanofuran dehydrogenase subunit C
VSAPLGFELLAAPGRVVDLAALTPGALAGKRPGAIARLRLGDGRRPPAVGDLFAISGDDPSVLRFRGLTPACRRLGAGLNGGRIEAEGHCGPELGLGMTGGEIRVRGDAGEAVGAGMRGGRIVVSGTVGDRLGGLAPGAVYGMNGGVIVVGDAGARAGERMRRGLIVIKGDCGALAGDRMQAGTVCVLGRAGAGAGLGLRRGTLLLLEAPAALAPAFGDCGELELAVMALIARSVGEHDRAAGRALAAIRRVRRWCGDLAYGGTGEILVAA